jgi:hypothetical protein
MSTPRAQLDVPPPRRMIWALAVALWLANTIYGCWPLLRYAISRFPDSGYWGIDAYPVYEGSKNLLEGHSYYANTHLLYTPLAMVLTLPATLVSEAFAVLALAVLKIVIAIWVTRWVTHGSWLAVLLVLTSLPVLNDVMIGNFMIPITAAMAISTFGEPRRRSGLALGILAAAIPKPLLAPYFVWLWVRRRKTAEGAILTAATATLLAAAMAGPGAYLAWVGNMAGATSLFIGPWTGNSGISAYAPALALPVAAILMAATVLVVSSASEERSLAWVLAAGILVSPYALWYSAVPLLLALPILRSWPRVYAISLMQPLVSASVALFGIVALMAGPLGAKAHRAATVTAIQTPSPSRAGSAWHGVFASQSPRTFL